MGLLRDGYVSRAAWHRSAILRDHGYNGSPLTTLLLGTVANQPFVSTLVFFHTMRWMDLVLVGLLVLAVYAIWITYGEQRRSPMTYAEQDSAVSLADSQ